MTGSETGQKQHVFESDARDEIERFLSEPDCADCGTYPCREHCGCDPESHRADHPQHVAAGGAR